MVHTVDMVERDVGPMARFEALKADRRIGEEVFARVAGGETLGSIARDWQIPRAAFSEWYMTVHGERYAAARVVRAEDLVQAALEAACAPADKDDVPAAKLKADVLMKIAARYDRERYGEQVKLTREVSIDIDAGILGFACDLLARIGMRPGIAESGTARLIEAEPQPEVAEAAEDLI